MRTVIKLSESKSIIEKPVEVLRSTGFERDNQNWIFLFLLIPAFILHFSIFWLVVDWPGYLNARLLEESFQKYMIFQKSILWWRYRAILKFG